MKRIKKSQVNLLKARILKKQGGKCPLCGRPLRPTVGVLDHDHKTGQIRQVLCNNCNGMEGRVLNKVTRAKGKLTEIEWLENLLNYWKLHQKPMWNILHYTYKTEDEKRLRKNMLARKRRAKAKAAKEK